VNILPVIALQWRFTGKLAALDHRLSLAVFVRRVENNRNGGEYTSIWLSRSTLLSQLGRQNCMASRE
jgi:hypothetical protein